MNRKKRAVTLIEIMIVILIIGLISGVLAYNFKGSLDKGKVFKSEQGASQIKSILMLELAKGDKTIEEITSDWDHVLTESGLAAKPQDLMKDGWGQPYSVTHVNDDIIVESAKHQKYLADAEAKKTQKQPVAEPKTKPKTRKDVNKQTPD